MRRTTRRGLTDNGSGGAMSIRACCTNGGSDARIVHGSSGLNFWEKTRRWKDMVGNSSLETGFGGVPSNLRYIDIPRAHCPDNSSRRSQPDVNCDSR